MRISIDKRIPVAAGMAGGSADAAAALRLLARASGVGDRELLHEIATGLGADVPAQVAPGRVLATGAGEHIERCPASAPLRRARRALRHAAVDRRRLPRGRSTGPAPRRGRPGRRR